MITRIAGVALLVAGLLAAATAVQESGLQESKVKVRWQGSTLQLTENGHTHELSIAGQYDAADIDSLKLRSAKESKGFIYLLLDITGPSKLPRDKSECGKGNESNIVWLKLDANWAFKEGASFLYNSCFSPIAVVDGPKWEGDIFKVTTKAQVATFDNTRPEQGLKIADVAAAK